MSLPWRHKPASSLKLSLDPNPAGATLSSINKASHKLAASSGATEISKPSSPIKNEYYFVGS